MRPWLLIVIAACALAGSVSAIESVEEALAGLSAVEFQEREKAAQWLSERGDLDAARRLEEIARGNDEAAVRARGLVDAVRFGLKPGAGNRLIQYIDRYREAGDDDDARLRALRGILFEGRDGKVNARRALTYEASRCSPSGRKQLAEFAADTFLPSNDPADIDSFASLFRDADLEILLGLDRAHPKARLAKRWIPLVEPEKRLALYEAWGEKVTRFVAFRELAIDRYAESARMAEQFKGEPETLKKRAAQLASEGLVEPVLAVEGLADGLGMSAEALAEITMQMRLHQLPANNWATGSEDRTSALDLARAVLVWGDESVVPEILDRAILAENGQSIRAFVSTVYLIGKLPEWTDVYRNRLEEKPTARNRRVLAQLLKADERYVEAFETLDPEADAGTLLFEQLAVESGRWDDAYRSVIGHRDTLGFDRQGVPGELADSMFQLCAAFLANLSRQDADVARHLDKLMAAASGDPPNQQVLKRQVEGLLIVGRPDLAGKLAVAHGDLTRAFEILMLEHRYEDAFRFALERITRGDAGYIVGEGGRITPGVGQLAVEQFSKIAPEKSRLLKKAMRKLPDFEETLKPIPPAPATVPASPITLPDLEEEAKILAKLREVQSRYGNHWTPEGHDLIVAATLPENAGLRKRVIDWWKGWDDGRVPGLDMMSTLILGEEWEIVAQGSFKNWQPNRRDVSSLFQSGFYLEKSGKVEEGRRRMRVAALMKMGTETKYMSSIKGAPDVGKALAERIYEGEWRVGLGTFFNYGRQRACFELLVESGEPCRAAHMWASANYFRIRDAPNSAYGNLFWPLNNGMHAQEGLGLDALKHGRIEDAERRLTESWRLSIEGKWLGPALVAHFQKVGDTKAARRVFDTFRIKLEQILEEAPGHEKARATLEEWRKMTGF